MIKDNDDYDAWDIIKQTLDKLILINNLGWHYIDLHIDNVIIDSNGKVHLIDYCAMTKDEHQYDKEKFFINLLMRVINFMYQLLERKLKLPALYNSKFLLKHISQQKYDELLEVKDDENKYRNVKSILFNEPAKRLKDIEQELIIDKINYIHDTMLMNFDIANYKHFEFYKTFDKILTEQQKQIDELKQRSEIDDKR